jgi:pSer/pThr/pTyr-binding forkhead associated (FHA) protein
MAMPEPHPGNNYVGKQLVVIRGPDSGRVFPMPESGTLTIGRSQTTDTRLIDPTISRNHCRVEVRDGRIVLLEAPKTKSNEQSAIVLVNNERVSKRELVPGDIIKIGNTELRFDDNNLSEAATVGKPSVQEAQALRVEIDESRKAKQVAEVADSSYFKGLKKKLDVLRRKRDSRPG